ncbi:hypothetical protein LOTGIDRAFT_238125 [Lottia gigantea]|uniref:Uncharacterized protein n=1 Tax=Lottia gigantea TaxID=225164 RepID=V4AD16_LOTGI|nr:hypothetical protein LOTGIDRAFT_238125 [Lottia gigantea]ESP01879.1 hypothetical protein LOTGIDRAFT_238125 [Lottia gigantea]
MKYIISIFLLFVIGLAVSHELKTEKKDINHAKDAQLTKDVAIKLPEEKSNIAAKVETLPVHKLRLLKKRSPGKRSRERYGYYYGGRSRGGHSRGGRSRGGHSRHRGHSHGGHSRRGGRSRHSGSSSGGRSSYGGRSYGSYYGNSRYNYGQSGRSQGGYVPYRGSGYPNYGSRYIGVIRYGSRPIGTNSISGNQSPISGNCNCPFSQNNEPSVESDEYDFDYLRQWQRAFSSHPCCRQRWEVYWSNSQRK